MAKKIQVILNPPRSVMIRLEAIAAQKHTTVEKLFQEATAITFYTLLHGYPRCHARDRVGEG
jgi:hypothetical protein